MLNKELFYNTIKPFEISVEEEAFKSLDTFAEMLIETNKNFNLTAIKEPDDVTVSILQIAYQFLNMLVFLKMQK